jgi:hypothetical protein
MEQQLVSGDTTTGLTLAGAVRDNDKKALGGSGGSAWTLPAGKRGPSVLIDLTYDASVSGAPARFIAAVDAAVACYQANFDAPINITIGWGSVGGGPTIAAGA